MYFSWSSRQIAAAASAFCGFPMMRARPRILPSTREYPSLRRMVSGTKPV
jgi:hypothetical protein